MTQTVYGIYSGCIYEGGGVRGQLWSDYNKALAVLMVAVRESIDENNKVYADDPDNMPIWKEISEGHWNNQIDEIHIQRFDLD